MKNNLKLKLLQFISYATSGVWIIAGLITIGGFFLSGIFFVINVSIGTIFVLLGIFFYLKEKTVIELFTKNCEIEDTLYKKVINGELIFIILAFFIGLVIVILTSFRVFEESTSVFG